MPLPTHRVSIFKSKSLEQWSNDYLIYVADIDQAIDVAEALIDFERSMHFDVIMFDYYRVSSTAVGDRFFRHVPINELGNRASTGLHFLPLFNTARMDIQTLNSDPGRKYFRLPVPEVDQQDGEFTATALGNMNTVITTGFMGSVAVDNVVTNKGNTASGASMHAKVQMRQLNRRRKKKIV